MYVCNSKNRLPRPTISTNLSLLFYAFELSHARREHMSCISQLSCEEKPQSAAVVCCYEFIQWKIDDYAILLGALQYY